MSPSVSDLETHRPTYSADICPIVSAPYWLVCRRHPTFSAAKVVRHPSRDIECSGEYLFIVTLCVGCRTTLTAGPSVENYPVQPTWPVTDGRPTVRAVSVLSAAWPEGGRPPVTAKDRSVYVATMERDGNRCCSCHSRRRITPTVVASVVSPSAAVKPRRSSVDECTGLQALCQQWQVSSTFSRNFHGVNGFTYLVLPEYLLVSSCRFIYGTNSWLLTVCSSIWNVETSVVLEALAISLVETLKQNMWVKCYKFISKSKLVFGGQPGGGKKTFVF